MWNHNSLHLSSWFPLLYSSKISHSTCPAQRAPHPSSTTCIQSGSMVQLVTTGKSKRKFLFFPLPCRLANQPACLRLWFFLYSVDSAFHVSGLAAHNQQHPTFWLGAGAPNHFIFQPQSDLIWIRAALAGMNDPASPLHPFFIRCQQKGATIMPAARENSWTKLFQAPSNDLTYGLACFFTCIIFRFQAANGYPLAAPFLTGW